MASRVVTGAAPNHLTNASVAAADGRTRSSNPATARQPNLMPLVGSTLNFQSRSPECERRGSWHFGDGRRSIDSKLDHGARTHGLDENFDLKNVS